MYSCANIEFKFFFLLLTHFRRTSYLLSFNFCYHKSLHAEEKLSLRWFRSEDIFLFRRLDARDTKRDNGEERRKHLSTGSVEQSRNNQPPKVTCATRLSLAGSLKPFHSVNLPLICLFFSLIFHFQLIE